MLSLATKIKIRMLKKGITGGDIARQAGVTRAAVCLTIKGEIRSRRLRSAIAKALDVKYRTLWGNQNNKAA